MKILFTAPNLSPHGGLRNLADLTNCLSEHGHEIHILDQSNRGCDWKKIHGKITNRPNGKYDLTVISSPHAIDLDLPGKKVIWLQMIEHLFKPHDRRWVRKCEKFYLANCPLISSATWGADYLSSIGQQNPITVIGTGTNLNDFPIVESQKDGQTILLESPAPTNAAKDVDRLALKVALKLKEEFGVKVIGYGALPLNKIDEYHVKPSLEVINDLYSRAAFMIKATKFDFRSTAPLEAMTKFCPTARAIEKGDEDLNSRNAVISGYDFDFLYDSAYLLLQDEEYRNSLARNGTNFIRQNTWENLLPQYLKVFESCVH